MTLAVLLGLLQEYPIIMTVITILGALVVLAQVIVAVTPGKKDDEMFDKFYNGGISGAILKFLASFAPLQKSDKSGFELSSKNVGDK